MKCLTIRQPWISLILDGKKLEEFRSWQTNYRGPIGLHAAKGIDTEGIAEFGYADAPRGVILGTAQLAGIRWTGAEYAWRLENVRRLPEPIPYRGALWLFNVPELDSDPPLFVPKVR